MSSEEGVRATNDDSSHCKRFAVDKGYWRDPYIHMFTPNAKQHHAPEINIGYYARVQGLRHLLEKFIACTKGKCQIVSLGAGFDTLYWNLTDAGIHVSLYVEVDLSEVTSKKLYYVRKSKVMVERISSDDKEIKFSGIDLHSKEYHLVSANLNSFKELDAKLTDCGLDKSVPTLFISECVLVYMEKSKTNELLQWITDNFQTVFFINYEQVNMGDRFGQVMMDNLKSRDCMLHIEYCDSLQSQIQRCLQKGFESADAMDMRNVLMSLPQDDVQRILHIEFLDDKEILDQLMSHYCYCWAFKDPDKIGLEYINFS